MELKEPNLPDSHLERLMASGSFKDIVNSLSSDPDASIDTLLVILGQLHGLTDEFLEKSSTHTELISVREYSKVIRLMETKLRTVKAIRKTHKDKGSVLERELQKSRSRGTW